MASGASEQVRAIVEAAESSAAGIKAQAELEARTLREDATAEGREHVARVSKASDALAERAQEMQAELKRLTDGLAAQLGRPEAPAAAAAATPAEPTVVAAKPDEDDDIADHAVDAAAGAEPSEPRGRGRAGARGRAEPEPEPAKAAAADDDSRGRAPDRAEHGAQRHPARRDRPLPERELRSGGPRRAAGRGLREGGGVARGGRGARAGRTFVGRGDRGQRRPTRDARLALGAGTAATREGGRVGAGAPCVIAPLGVGRGNGGDEGGGRAGGAPRGRLAGRGKRRRGRWPGGGVPRRDARAWRWARERRRRGRVGRAARTPPLRPRVFDLWVAYQTKGRTPLAGPRCSTLGVVYGPKGRTPLETGPSGRGVRP